MWHQSWLLLVVCMCSGPLLCQGGSVKSCIKSSEAIRETGDGTTPESCMSCDPTKPTCPEGCQSLINKFYRHCHGVCLPDGYYFDPKMTLSDCWKPAHSQILIDVERCGCKSSAKHHSYHMLPLLLSLLIAYAINVQH